MYLYTASVMFITSATVDLNLQYRTDHVLPTNVLCSFKERCGKICLFQAEVSFAHVL